MNCRKFVNLVCVTKQRDGNYGLLIRLKSIDIPDGNKSIAVAREHELSNFVHVEGIAGHLILILKLLLVCFSIERVLRA